MFTTVLTCSRLRNNLPHSRARNPEKGNAGTPSGQLYGDWPPSCSAYVWEQSELMRSTNYWTFGVRLVSWVLLTAITVMTLGPISMRPQTHFSPDFERFAAYLAVGTCFALSYQRRRLWLLGLFLVAMAGVLEIGQSFVPGRDPRLIDFLFKACGAVIGLMALRIAYFMVPLWKRRCVCADSAQPDREGNVPTLKFVQHAQGLFRRRT
jgi:VanZ family protein